MAVTVHSDSHTAFGKNCSTALAARSRQGREHAVNAVALIERSTRDGNSAVSGGYMTDRPKSDGVTDRADLPCPSCEDERGVCSQSGLPCSRPAGSVVGLALHRGLTSLPCLPESTREGESGVAAAVIRN